MPDIHVTSTLDAPLSASFAYVDDPATVPNWMFGVHTFQPQAGGPAQGLGAIYDVVFSVKPIKIKTTMKIIEYVPDELIRFDTVKGFYTASSWHFTRVDDTSSTLEVRFRYELPGGLAGKAMGKALEPIVAIAIKESERTLAKQVAELPAAGR